MKLLISYNLERAESTWKISTKRNKKACEDDAVFFFQLTVWLNIGLSIRDPNWVSVFRVYQNQSHSGYMKIWFGTGSGSIRFRSELVNL